MKALLVAGLALIGCDASRAPDVVVIGGPGAADGRFATPRAAAFDARSGKLYVVDKTARIQRFSADGRFERGWRTPAMEKGRPTGLAVDAEGRVVVADTHYHRILWYSPDGELLATLGGGESREPGRFIYPVGVAVAADGTLYVSEFGGDNDRIQAFGPDRRLVRTFGRYGEGPGEFKRPQGIALSPAGDRLYVADAANHRVQVFEAGGRLLGTWGGLLYPYSVSVEAGGDVFVAEYGRHCVTRFRPDGARAGTAGGAGTEPGRLDTPWGVVCAGERVFVVDSNNHRVQSWPSEAVR